MSAATRNEVERKVLTVVHDVLACPEGELDGSKHIIGDLGADSMAVVTLAIALDDEFDLEINLAANEESDVTISDIIDYILGRLQ